MKSLFLIPLFLTGCVMVPKTTIVGSIGNQPFSLSSPKDSSLAGLDITASTNGTIHLHIDTLQARMNPDVITTTGAAQAQVIQAAAQAGAMIAGQVAGAAVKTP